MQFRCTAVFLFFIGSKVVSVSDLYLCTVCVRACVRVGGHRLIQSAEVSLPCSQEHALSCIIPLQISITYICRAVVPPVISHGHHLSIVDGR